MKKIVFLLGIIALLVACNSSKQTIYKESNFQINFGNSGGFTNASMEYLINGDGNIFKIEKGNEIYVKTLLKKELSALKKSVKDSGFEKFKIEESGNITYFIKVKTTEFENEIRWSNQASNKEAEDLYEIFLSTIKK